MATEQQLKDRVIGHYCQASTSVETAMAIARSLQMCGEDVDSRSIREIAGVLRGILGSAVDDLREIRDVCWEDTP